MSSVELKFIDYETQETLGERTSQAGLIPRQYDYVRFVGSSKPRRVEAVIWEVADVVSPYVAILISR